MTGISILEALKLCIRLNDLERGKAVHAAAVANGHASRLHVANTLVDMYSKCGSMRDAQNVFDQMQTRDVVSWNVLILGYARDGKGEKALQLFNQIPVTPNEITYLAALKACAGLAGKEEGKRLRGTGRLIKLCALEKGMAIHSSAARSPFGTNPKVVNALMGVYAKCGCMVAARMLFDGVDCIQDAFSWTILVQGYAENGEGKQALDVFHKMLREGRSGLNSLILVVAFKACTCLAEAEVGRRVADKLVKVNSLEKCMDLHMSCVDKHKQFSSDVRVISALIQTYAKCGCIQSARKVFNGMRQPDVVCWTALILGYVVNGDGDEALNLFYQMDCCPDSFAYVAALKACICLAEREVCGQLVKVALEKGRALVNEAYKSKLMFNMIVANTSMELLAKCGSMSDAQRIADEMQHLDAVSWNILITGYANNREGYAALDRVFQMVASGCSLDDGLYVSALRACGLLGALDLGRALHAALLARNLQHHGLLITTLIDFYGKCWCMEDAQRVFDELGTGDDCVQWTTLLAGYSRCGDADKVFKLFEEMVKKVQPNNVTFLCLLATCSHAGLVDKGKKYFEYMCSTQGIHPSIEHYNCMVDMLARANRVEDAVKLVQAMPFKPNHVTCRALLSA